MELLFTHEDLGRTRVATQANVSVEVESSLRLLRERPHPCFARWRRSLPRYLRSQSYEKVAIEPFWHRIEMLITADRARRMNQLLDGGLDALLNRLHPGIRWRAPHLTVRQGQPVRLRGQGLLLQPSVFFFRAPEIRVSGSGQVVLLYPVSCEIDEPAAPAKVSPLIGRTRASLLRLLSVGPATTTDLATGTGVSMAAISQHLGVLRDSGMVVTQTLGRSRLHTLTPVGKRLLG